MKKFIKIVWLSVCVMICIFLIGTESEAASRNKVQTSITKLESKSKGFKVTWKKKKGIKGYQIAYSTNKKFSNMKTVTISKPSIKNKTISNLKGCNKKYYVKIRTYIYKSGKKIYSSWSKVKTVTTLQHSFSKATCTSAKKCRYCNKTSGFALGHKYVNNKCIRCGKVDPDSLPVRLEKLHVISSSGNYKYDGNASLDTYGNTYVGVHIFGYSYSGEAYAHYNLDSKYKVFSGTIISSPSLDDCAYADYYIYVDDVLVYYKTQQECTTNKIDFKIDVSGGTKLTIKTRTYFKPGVGGVGYLGAACIANAQLMR